LGSGITQRGTAMGMLLSFAPLKTAKAKPRSKPAAGATASIIIFPGIRYERQKVTVPMKQMRVAPDLSNQAPVQY
jgi:hypothetical protein